LVEEDPYVLLDEAMTILERLEAEVERLAAKAKGDGRITSGEVYKMYTLLVDLGDKLRQLRVAIFEACSRNA
jgi:hypothetical protein